MGGHFSVVLAGNGVGRPFGTFFKHASTFDKVFGAGHGAPPRGSSNSSSYIGFSCCSLQFAAGSNHRVAKGPPRAARAHDQTDRMAACPAFFVWLGVVPYPLREASADDFLRGPKVACQCCYFPLAFSPPAADAYSRIAFSCSVGVDSRAPPDSLTGPFLF